MNVQKFQVPEPTVNEVAEAANEFKKTAHKELSKTDAIQYARLGKELDYWLMCEKECEKANCVTEDEAKKTKTLYKKELGKSLTLDQAYAETKKLYYLSISKERLRIKSELEALLNRYK